MVCVRDDSPTIHVMIPIKTSVSKEYLSLVNGAKYSPITHKEFYDWTIRPGDRAQFSDDGEFWRCSRTFKGMSKDFKFMDNCNVAWPYIRPVPADSPEKVEAMRRLKNAERELELARKQLKEMK